jgi:organic hydroperoxide reductase OsmC/OhrA
MADSAQAAGYVREALSAHVHRYQTSVHWSADGKGTTDYRSYSRNYTVGAAGKPEILGSSDPTFRGDTSRYSPEELLVASLSACHMLWYLHLCATNGITVLDYRDDATGAMEESADGGGRFVRVELRPAITIFAGSRDRALGLHRDAHRLCFIARSVNFPVEVVPGAIVGGAPD